MTLEIKPLERLADEALPCLSRLDGDTALKIHWH